MTKKQQLAEILDQSVADATNPKKRGAAVRQRDSQRVRVYRAERTLSEFGANGFTVTDMQNWLDRACASNW